MRKLYINFLVIVTLIGSSEARTLQDVFGELLFTSNPGIERLEFCGKSLKQITSAEMRALAQNYPNLKVLNLFYNNLFTLPPEIGTLTNLRELHLDGNHMLVTLPVEIYNLKNLEMLCLSDTTFALSYSRMNQEYLQRAVTTNRKLKIFVNNETVLTADNI